MANQMRSDNLSKTGIFNLQSEVAYRTKLQNICNKIYAAEKLDDILIDLKDEITTLFEAERITVFVVDGKRRQLVSRFKTGGEISEIRIPVSADSIAGFAAFRQRPLNIKDVYDDRELASIAADLRFDKSWDSKFGFRTRQVLAYPIAHSKYMLGVMQLINRKSGDRFTAIDEKSVGELAKILGIALYNQKRIARTRPSKFDSLLQNNVITRKELDKAIEDARRRNLAVEEILMKDLKIPKKEIGSALEKYFKTSFNDSV